MLWEWSRPTDHVPSDILTCADAELLNKWLSLFVLEVCKIDGTSTLNMLLSGLKRFMVKANPNTPNFLFDKDTCFAGLRGTRNTVARKLCEDGVGTSVKHAAVISSEEEESVWKVGTLGVKTPKALLNAIFYMNGKVLCLRGRHDLGYYKGYSRQILNEGRCRPIFVEYTANSKKCLAIFGTFWSRQSHT